MSKKQKRPVLLDARWCTDGVWRCDLVPADHRDPDADRPGHWQWQTQEEFEKLFQGDWDPRRSYSTYAEPNHRQQEEELEKLVRFLQTSQLFDEEFMRVMRRRYGIDKDPSG